MLSSAVAGREAGLTQEGEARGRLGLFQLFLIFFKAGCAFGGGLGILALLEEELVTRRRLMTRADLVTLWSIGRIIPCGTMTSVTVALGHRFGGLLGSVVALIAVIVPGFTCTVLLAAAYRVLGHGPALDYTKVTLLPAALALILVSAVRIGRELPFPSLEIVLAVAAFIAALFFHINPVILLFAGGGLGAVFLRAKRP
jgi:chromate transporter